jgi:hypothetical protein
MEQKMAYVWGPNPGLVFKTGQVNCSFVQTAPSLIKYVLKQAVYSVSSRAGQFNVSNCSINKNSVPFDDR